MSHLVTRVAGAAVALTIALGYGAYQLGQQGSSQEFGLNTRSSTKSDLKGDYGQVSDPVPNEWLSESVLTDTIKKQLKSTNIKYNHTGAFIINDNNTDLDASVSSRPYVHLDKLDAKRRPQAANALLMRSSREYRNRAETGNSKTINPVGWHQLTLSKGKVLYNRGHSIGYALAGSIKDFDASEANYQNITTQTAWANQSSNGNPENTGQNYYETLVRKTLDKNPAVRIRYRVTPLYDGGNLVPSGNHLEAKSNDNSLQFNVFVPNVQPGVVINYANGFAHVN